MLEFNQCRLAVPLYELAGLKYGEIMDIHMADRVRYNQAERVINDLYFFDMPPVIRSGVLPTTVGANVLPFWMEPHKAIRCYKDPDNWFVRNLFMEEVHDVISRHSCQANYDWSEFTCPDRL